MRHEGYLGAIGAFIKGAEEEAGISGYTLIFFNYVVYELVVIHI